MKKIIAILLACTFALALAACNGGSAAPTDNKTTQSQSAPAGTAPALPLQFAPKGTAIEIGAPPAPVLEALGEPLANFESPSCALKAKDVTYKYQGFELTVTYPEQGEDYISGVRLLDDTYEIPGGVTIGSTIEDITAAYGTDYREDNGHYYYAKGLCILHFAITEGRAVRITYEYDFDNA